MDKKKYTYYDSSNVEHSIEISKEDFAPVQKDKSIHDQKFKTKPTTFLKDAFKRFCKNKSSVTGAIILGILLLGSIIIPLADTANVDEPHPQETFLEPKLFPSGTGFYDGTKRMTNIPCDPSLTAEGPNGEVYFFPSPESFPSSAVKSLSLPRENNNINAPSSLVTGGFVQLVPTEAVYSETMEDRIAKKSVLTSDAYNFDINKAYGLNIEFSNEIVEGSTKTDYRVYLTYGLEHTGDEVFETTLRDYSKNYSVLNETNIMTKVKATLEEKKKDAHSSIGAEFDVSTAKIKDMRLAIDVLPIKEATADILIKTINFVAPEGASNLEKDTLKVMSLLDANKALMTTVDQKGYWNFNSGLRNLYHASGYVCDFTFDTYEAAYGKRTAVVPENDFKTYVENGWINELPDFELAYNLTIGGGDPNEVFVAVSNNLTARKAPVSRILDVEKKVVVGITTYTITCEVDNYKYLGYESMPIYLWGTGKDGKDLLKISFIGLRNSLLLGICTFVICFSFGLVFGSISGYFGGTVDLLLQRFAELLSGVPRIVIMTLCVLNLGQSPTTFILAMCLTGWIGVASLTRTQFYRFRDREYTLASRTLGASNPSLIFKHILPNAMGTIITSAVLMIPSVIFTEATISYLGLGFKGMLSLGVTLSDNQQFLLTYPHLLLLPSLIMALIMISFNLFGNGLRDAFNPSLKGSE